MSARGSMGLMSSLKQDRSVLEEKLRPGTVKRVLTFAGPYKWLLTVYLALVMLDAGITVINPLLYRQIINNGILKGNGALVVELALLVAGLAAVDAALGLVQALQWAQLSLTRLTPVWGPGRSRRWALSCLAAKTGRQNALQRKSRRNGVVILRIVWRPLVAAIFCAAFGASAFAADNYQTDIGPTPKNGRQGANVQGRGTVLAKLDNNTFSLHGTFSGLSSPATEAHLYMGSVMGGTGSSIGDLTIAQAQSGDISGTFALTPDQVAALNSGKLYVMLDSQSAPKGNLWGWFQPAHITVGPDVPQMGHWYIPNILDNENNNTAKKTNS